MIRSQRRRASVVLMGAGLIVSIGFAPAAARSSSLSIPSKDRDAPLVISVDMDHRTVKTGESIEFETVVKNKGEEESPALVVAMNIVNLGSGDPVDPEDWSPERTQSIDPLAPHESATNPWIVDAILDGDYMVYIVVIPSPDGPETTSQPLASSGIHLSVTKFIRLNPEGVLPIALAMPIVLTLCMFGSRWVRSHRYG